jgi:hypothetical protein
MMLGSSQGFKLDLQFTQKKKKKNEKDKKQREREREKKNFCQRNGNRIVLLH